MNSCIAPALARLRGGARRLALTLALPAVLAGCASTSTAPVQQAPGGPSGQAPAPVVSLPAEQRRLADLFRGTPVVFEMTAEGHLRAAVPLQFSFDKGRAAVKAPLAKVLDYLAPSIRSPGMRARVATPGDGGGIGRVAFDRAASTRDYLVSKGVPVGHIASLQPVGGDDIEIVVGKL